jgi:hypothetical protein
MKKTIVLLTIVLAFLAAPVFAEVTISGEMDYTAMINGDEVAGEFDKVEIDILADIDDNNTFSLELEDKVKSNDIGDSPAIINWATVTTDWSAVLGIEEVGITTVMGYTDFGGGDSNYITGYEFENIGGVYTDKEGAAKVSLSFADGMVSPYVAYMFDPYDKVDSVGVADDTVEALMGAVIDFAPVWADVYYLTAKDGYVDGIFGMEVYGNVDLGDGMGLDLVGSFATDLNSDAADGEASSHGFGGSFSVDAMTFGLSIKGNDDQALEYVGLDAAYAMSEMVTLRAGTALYTGDDDSMDTLVNVNLMAEVAASEGVTYKVGYLMTDGYGGVATFSPGAETETTDGGVWMGVNVNF